MKQILAFAAAATLLTATGAFAQAAMSGPSGNMSNNAMMKSGAATPKDKAADMQAGKADSNTGADTSADASAPKAKPHHRMAKNEAAENASEAEVTRQLNEQQAQMTKGGGAGMQ